MSCIYFTDAAAVSADSESSRIVVGETALLQCAASLSVLDVHWTFLGTSSSEDHVVYSQGSINNGYKKRFSVNRSTDEDFTLVIRDVKTDDAGVYLCIRINQDGSVEETAIHVAALTSTYECCAVGITCLNNGAAYAGIC